LNLTDNQAALVGGSLTKSNTGNIVFGEMKDWDYKYKKGTVIDGRYYLPADFDPAKKYPLIVYYYGGTTPVSDSTGENIGSGGKVFGGKTSVRSSHTTNLRSIDKRMGFGKCFGSPFQCRSGESAYPVNPRYKRCQCTDKRKYTILYCSEIIG